MIAAAFLHHTNLVNFLLQQPGIDVSVQTVHGLTALECTLKPHTESLHANYETAGNMIRLGANIEQLLHISKRPMLVDAWVDNNQKAANELVNLGASISISEHFVNQSPYMKIYYQTQSVPQQIELSKQYFFKESAKWLGFAVECLSFQLYVKSVGSKIAPFLFEENSLGMRALKIGRAMMHNRLLQQSPAPAPTPAPIPRALLFRGNFENLPQPILNEIEWQQFENNYNYDFPERKGAGYGAGAVVVYTPKP